MKKLLGNIGLVVLLNLLIKPVWLLVENQVQDQVGHAAFGGFMALFSLAYICGVLADLGLNQFTTKHLADPVAGRASFLPVLFPLKWGLALLFPGVMVGAGALLGYRGQELYWLLVIAAGFAGSHFLSFLRAILQGGQLFFADAWASVSERLLQLVLVAALFRLGLTLESFIYSRTVAVALAMAGGLLLLRHYLGPVRYRLSWPLVRQVARASFPFALILLLYGLNERVDMVMLGRLSSQAETGIYAAAYRWADAVMMYLWLVLPVFFARFAASVADPAGQSQLLRLGQVVVCAPLIFVCLFVFYHGKVLFWQFTHSSSQEISRMQLNLVLLFAHVLVQGFFGIYSTLLTASNYEKQVSALVAGSVILNVMLNSFLVPPYGSLAAAATTLCCSAFVSVGYLWLVKRKLPVRLPAALLVKLLFAGLLLAGVFQGLQGIPLAWYWQTLLAGGVYGAILFVLRIVSLQQIGVGLRWREERENG